MDDTQLGEGYRCAAAMTALSGACSILLGAWESHRLALRLEGDCLHLYDIALRYQVVHTLALLSLVLVSKVSPRYWVTLRSIWLLWLGGLVLFSGSLYGMALTTWQFGWVTPIGGLMLIAGWLVLAWRLWQR